MNRLYSMSLGVLLALGLSARSEDEAGRTPSAADAASVVESDMADKQRSPYLLAPTVMSNPAFGTGLGGIAMYFFRPDKADGVSPTSMLTGVGIYSDTDSYFLGLFSRMYFKEDLWRFSLGGIKGKMNNHYELDRFADTVEFTTEFDVLFTRVERRVYGDYFLGGKLAATQVDYSEGNEASREYFELAEVEDQANAQFGILGQHDSRDHVRYPTTGNHSEVIFTVVPEWLGADDPYNVLEGFANQYITLADQQILALRLSGRFTPDDTPYAGLSTLGRGSDLRGYTSGENVAENLIAAQAEYRWTVWRRLGVVGFAGVSELYDGSLNSLNSDTFFPSAGLGLRFMLNKENKMNFRADYAWGSDDEDGFYVGVGEAF